ncbi:hypothetical protein, partial [Gordonia aichiensis]
HARVGADLAQRALVAQVGHACVPPSMRISVKKRMKTIGRVDVPQEAFVAALSSDAASDKPKGK